MKPSNYVLLTFVTKYSRAPMEEYALKRYNAVTQIKQESVEIPLYQKFGERKVGDIIINAFEKQAQKLKIKILACNILTDHAHIVLNVKIPRAYATGFFVATGQFSIVQNLPDLGVLYIFSPSHHSLTSY